jgi:hypothetical protein
VFIYSIFSTVGNGAGHLQAWRWGSTSTLLASSSTASPSSRDLLYNAWLANIPQLLLSVFYLSWNRQCTTHCFNHEWNDHASSRRGLRVTDPTAGSQQREAYFLQLPYRWAVPLVVCSGFLHWLLSQSLFLVRILYYDQSGTFLPEVSKSACGYSIFSLFIFSIVFMLMLGAIFVFTFRQVDVKIPPAQHCSLVISAACHPPPDDDEPQLKAVQWGTASNPFEGPVEHCSFTTEDVTAPVEGMLYE